MLAGNIHLGAPLRRLSETLLPVWRYAAVTAPLGERLAETITFKGSVTDSDGIDHFRVVDGDRLMWASPETTWAASPARFAPAIARRIRTIFPRLGRVEISEVWGGAVGQTVHGMPQIGQLRRRGETLGGTNAAARTDEAEAGHDFDAERGDQSVRLARGQRHRQRESEHGGVRARSWYPAVKGKIQLVDLNPRHAAQAGNDLLDLPARQPRRRHLATTAEVRESDRRLYLCRSNSAG